MSILAISRGSFNGGVALANQISEQLGWKCLSREELCEEAIQQGVPVGKLQTSMIRPPRVKQRLGPVREFYLSCVTSILCKYALQGNLIYHGHTGHLLLPGIPNIFRIRVQTEMEYRIQQVVERLDLSPEKAEQYIHKVDDDRDRWVRFLFGIDWHDPSQYDIVFNLDHVRAEHATAAISLIADLPDFELSPGSRSALENLYLSSRARFLLAKDPRTSHADFKVTAHDGEVQVICMPQYAAVTDYIEEVLQDLEGCLSVNWTIAGSNILWLGERFDAQSELLSSVLRVARNWDAAVEVMTCCSAEEIAQAEGMDKPLRKAFDPSSTGGIEDDVPAASPPDTRGVSPVLDKLLREGCAGGHSRVYGDKETLMRTLGHRSNYSMVVLGDLFVDKSDTVSSRMKSDLRSLLSESIKAPVVDEDELKQKLTYGLKDYVRVGGFLLVAALLFSMVFMNQDLVLQLLSRSDATTRVYVIAGLLIFTPIFAFSWGSFTKRMLRMAGVH